MTTNVPGSDSQSSLFRVPRLLEIFWGKLANQFRQRARQRKGASLRKSAQSHSGRALRLEALEPRLLLSADLAYTSAAGTAMDAALRVADVDGVQTLQLVDNGTSAVLGEALLDQDINVSILGAERDDALRIDFDPTTLAHQVNVSFDGAGGDDKLTGPALDSTWYVDGVNSGSVGSTNFSGVENLEGAADNEDTFIIEASGSLSGVADGGAGGFDSLVVNGTFDTMVFTPTGPHSGYVDRDGDVVAYAGLEPVNAGNATHVVFNGDGGASDVDTWILEDSPTPGNLQLRSTSGQIETTLFAATATTVTLNLGTGNDSITIASPGDSGFTGTIIVNGQADDDTLVVSDYSGDVTFAGGGGTNTIAATKNQNFILTNSSLSTTDGLNVGLTNVGVANLTGGGGDNTFTVSGWSGSGTLNGMGGDDTVAATKNQDFTLTNGSLTATDGMSLTLASIQVANLTGGGGHNTFAVGDWSGTATLTGAGGNDKYVLDDNWGTVNVSEGLIASGTDTLDFSLLSASTTLTALQDRTRIDSSDGSTLNQTGSLAEEIDVSLIPGFAGAAGDLTDLLDDLVAFVHRLHSTADGIDQLINQIPLLNQTGASLAGLLGFTERISDLRDDLNPIIESVGNTPKLSTLIAALNGLAEPAPFTSVNFSTGYRAVDDGDFLDILIDFDFAAHVDETIDLSFGADAENAGIALDVSLGVDVDLTGHLTFGLDLYSPAAPQVFLVPGGTIAIDVAIDGGLGGASLNLGFLELDISGGTVDLDAGVRLTLTDPNNADGRDRITLTEFTTGAIGNLVMVTEDSNPATLASDPQTFSVTASLSVDPGVKIGLLDLSTFTVNFAVNLSGSVFGTSDGPASPTVSLTADPGTPLNPADDINLLDFSNISPTEALGMLQQVIDALAAMAKAEAMKAQIPFTGGKTLGEVLDFAALFKEEMLDPLFVSGDALRPDNNGDGTPDLNFSSIQGLVNRLTTALGIGTPLTALYDPATKELSFSIGFDRVLAFGEAKVTELRPGASAINEQQTIQINATGGTFRLAFPDDKGAPRFTSDIAYNAPATGMGSVEAALEALRATDGVTPLLSNVTVTKSGNTYTVEFLGNQAGKNVTLLTADPANLTGGLFPLNFGVSLGEIAGVQTTGSFGMAADLSAGLTFGFDLSPSQKIEVAPATYSNAVEVTVERPEGATSNKVQIVTVRNATSGQFQLMYNGTPTAPIAFNAPATGLGSVETALQAVAGITDVTVVRTEVGNHRFYVVTFNTPSDPAALLTAVSAQAPDTPLAGPADNGILSADAHFDVELFNKPTIVTLTTQEGAAPGTNETQRITLVNATGGTFSLSFNGVSTDPILHGAAASVVKSELEGLASIGSGNVLVAKVGTSYVVTFQGALAATNVAKITAEGSKLQSTDSIGTINVTVDDAATTANTSLTDLRDDVQKAVNTALADEGLTLGFLTGGMLSTGALGAGSVTAAHNALTSFPNDIAFTLKLHLSTGDKEVTGRLRAVDVLDANANGSLFNNDGSLNLTELNAAVTPGTLATALQAALRTALAKAGFGGDGGSGDFNITVDTAVVGSDTRLRINVAAVPTGGD